MNAQQHYAEAERLLRLVEDYTPEAVAWAQATSTAAQAHATLALAAATSRFDLTGGQVAAPRPTPRPMPGDRRRQ